MRNERDKILKYKERRDARLAKRGLRPDGEERMDSVEAFYERRNARRSQKDLPKISYNRGGQKVDNRGKMWYNNDGGKDTIDGQEVEWITLKKTGKPAAINGEGVIVAGPTAVKGKTMDQVKSEAKENTESKKSEGKGSAGGSEQKKEYKPSANYERYKQEALKKIGGVFREDPEHSTGINYRGNTVQLRVQSAEAQELFNTLQDKNKPNPSLEELRNHPVVKELDDISRQCTQALGGFTSDIHTPEREELRKEIGERFLSLGSARVDPKTGKTIDFDGEIKKEFQAVIYTGLPAVGKSTAVDPLSQEMGAFVFDNDTIKGMIPEFEATGGAAAGAVHEESSNIQKTCLKEFLSGGSRNGDNIAYPTIGDKPEKILKIIKQFEGAGYTVKVKCLNAPAEMSAGRVVARAIETGRIIDSEVVLGYGDRPTRAYEALEKYDQENGTEYAAGISDAK